jgi:hypothetical protein
MKNKLLKNRLEIIAQRGVPEDINLWPRISGQLNGSSSMSHYRLKPILSILIAGFGLLLLSGAVYAFGRTLGYIPNIGLVDNSSGIRMLAEPVAETREGVTLTISNVIAYNDRVELIYDVKGISPENDGSKSEDARRLPMNFCGGVNIGSSSNMGGDARLQLPDGTVLERDYSGKYSQNAFAMKPVYASTIPAEVTRMTFQLDCIPHARRGAVPENWSVPLELKTVQSGTIVGAPVIEIEPPNVQPQQEPAVSALPVIQPSTVPTPAVKLNLSKIVPLDTMSIFYFSMEMENKDPSLISIMPANVYVIDSQGQKIQLIGNFAWQPFEHRVGSEFQYTSQTKPADGPITLIVENAVAYYAPLYTDPQQATQDEMSFAFDAGINPKYGQIWNLGESFVIAGYSINVKTARAASYDDIKSANFIDGSQGYDYGYDFLVEADPSVKMQVEMDIMSEAAACWLSNSASNLPESSSIHYIQLCQGEYPTGKLRVTIRELSVLVSNTWQAVWVP